VARKIHSQTNNHYVPQFLLKHWENSGSRVEFRILGPNGKVAEAHPRNVCAQRGIYTDKVEAKLSELEGLVSQSWEQLFWEFGSTPSKNILALFLAVQWRRGPMEILECADIRDRLWEFTKDHMPPSFFEADKGFDLFNSQILDSTHDVALDLAAKQWTVLNFRGVPVLEICDHPVVMIHPDVKNFGSRTKGAMTFFPATPSIGLLMTDPDDRGDRIEFMHPNFGERLNQLTRMNAVQFLVTPPTK